MLCIIIVTALFLLWHMPHVCSRLLQTRLSAAVRSAFKGGFSPVFLLDVQPKQLPIRIMRRPKFCWSVWNDGTKTNSFKQNKLSPPTKTTRFVSSERTVAPTWLFVDGFWFNFTRVKLNYARGEHADSVNSSADWDQSKQAIGVRTFTNWVS